MSRPKITVLCEDKQHEAFIRRFLRKRKKRNQVQAVTRPNTGAGEQFVRENYPAYLDAVRKRGGLLVVMIDADTYSIEQRLKQMDGACEQKHVLPRTASDKVALFIPARNIETWLAYLDGGRVNETDTYPRLQRERDCQRHVDALVQMCTEEKLRPPSPPSLEAACREYDHLF